MMGRMFAFLLAFVFAMPDCWAQLVEAIPVSPNALVRVAADGSGVAISSSDGQPAEAIVSITVNTTTTYTTLSLDSVGLVLEEDESDSNGWELGNGVSVVNATGTSYVLPVQMPSDTLGLEYASFLEEFVQDEEAANGPTTLASTSWFADSKSTKSTGTFEPQKEGDGGKPKSSTPIEIEIPSPDPKKPPIKVTLPAGTVFPATIPNPHSTTTPKETITIL